MSPRPDPARLVCALEDSGWLRQLALALVRDPAEAEDLAQETWVARLAGGPAGAVGRGWLTTVARRTLLRRRRADARRRAREAWAAAAAPEFGEPADAVPERLELARVLAEELQRLEEPFRRALVRRYFDGVAPSALAAEEGVPAGTVRWRLAEGRARLRERLVRRDGRAWPDWAHALVPASLGGGAAVPPLVPLVPAVAGLTMLKSTLLGALLGALLAGGPYLARSRDASPVPARDALVSAAPETATPAPAGPDAAPAGRSAPRVAAAGDPAAAPSDTLFPRIASGRVVDESGAPVSDARVALEGPDGSIASGTTAGGAWAFPDVAPGASRLVATRTGYLTARAEVVVPEHGVLQHDVVLRVGAVLPVRFEDAAGNDLARGADPGDWLRLLGVAASTEPPGTTVGAGVRSTSRSAAGHFASRGSSAAPADLDPRYQGLLSLSEPTPLWVALTYRGVVIEARRVDGSERELVFVVDAARLAELHGTVRVRLVAADSGAPITQGVSLDHPSGGVRVNSRVEGDAVVFSSVPPGALDLELDDDGYERIEREVVVAPGEVVEVGPLRVGRRATFEVRCVDEAGAPCLEPVRAARPALVAGPCDLDQRISTQPDAQGVSRISWLAPGETLVRVGGSGGRARVAALVDTARTPRVELVVPSGAEVVLRGLRSGGEACFALVDAAGLALWSGEQLPRVTCLAPGDYVVRAMERGALRGERAFRVGTERVVVDLGGL